MAMGDSYTSIMIQAYGYRRRVDNFGKEVPEI